MDIQQYIASATLEQYVLGLLSLSEKRKVESYAEKYVEIQEEIDKIEATLQDVALSNAVACPVPEASIMHAIELSEKVNPPPSSVSTSKSTTNKITLNKYLFFFLTGVFLLKGAIIGVLAYQQWQTNDKMEKVNEQINQLQQDNQDIAEAKRKIEQDFNILRSIARKSVTLKGTENHSSSFAVVHWDAEKQSVFLDLMNLPSPPKDKVYQLWAIVDGKPVSAGVINFEPNEGLLQEAIFVANPQAFAITIEPAAGSLEPSMDQMVVIGTV